jgi:hypothetical protein
MHVVILIFLATLFTPVTAMDKILESESEIHKLELVRVADYNSCLEIERRREGAVSKDGYFLSELSGYINFADYLVLHPSPVHSRIFITRDIEDYVNSMQRDKKPTRLIIGCGHVALQSFCGVKMCSHSEDYFTVNIDNSNNPDVTGNIFAAVDYIFRAVVWDFVLFEGVPLHTGMLYNGKSFDEVSHIIANSLKSGGVWLVQQGQAWFPATIIIGDKKIETGVPAEWLSRSPEARKSIMRMICSEFSALTDDDVASFNSPDTLQIAVDSFFQKRGFRKAELKMHLEVDSTKMHAELAEVPWMKFFSEEEQDLREIGKHLYMGIEKIVGVDALLEGQGLAPLSCSAIVVTK